jgi:hypothetical protein
MNDTSESEAEAEEEGEEDEGIFDDEGLNETNEPLRKAARRSSKTR